MHFEYSAIFTAIVHFWTDRTVHADARRMKCLHFDQALVHSATPDPNRQAPTPVNLGTGSAETEQVESAYLTDSHPRVTRAWIWMHRLGAQDSIYSPRQVWTEWKGTRGRTEKFLPVSSRSRLLSTGGNATATGTGKTAPFDR